MNKEQKNQIEQKLNNEVEETKTKITKYKELSQPIAPENSIGRVSRMDAINNKSVVEAALRELRTNQQKLRDASCDNCDVGLRRFTLYGCAKCSVEHLFQVHFTCHFTHNCTKGYTIRQRNLERNDTLIFCKII